MKKLRRLKAFANGKPTAEIVLESGFVIVREADLAKAERYERALRAILARIDGVYDDPDLMSMGPLHTDRGADVRHFAEEALK